MYLTAQRVVEPDGPNHGLNAFLYVHGQDTFPLTHEDYPDVELVAEHPPTAGEESIVTLPPGGNAVLSYLDVACEDDVTAEELNRALDEFEAYVPVEVEDSPFSDSEGIGEIGLQIHLSPSTPLRPELEYRTLAETVLQLLSNHLGDGSHRSLRIAMTRDGDEARFWPLTTDGLDIPGPPDSSEGQALRINHDTLEAFEDTRGSFYPVAAESIFGMGPEELIEHGGVQIVDDETGELVWRGP